MVENRENPYSTRITILSNFNFLILDNILLSKRMMRKMTYSTHNDTTTHKKNFEAVPEQSAYGLQVYLEDIGHQRIHCRETSMGNLQPAI